MALGCCAAKVSNPIVDVEPLVENHGSLPVVGRYVTTRRLEKDYKVDERVLGTGMSGPVQLAHGKEDSRKYAVKSFKKTGLSEGKWKDLKGEVEIYLTLDHPHVARLEMVYETDEDIHIVMEYMAGGELYDRLSKQKRYTEQVAAETTQMMLLAVAYLHSNKVAHRDLKLENFLYEDKDSEVLKLIDFGFAKVWNHGTLMSQSCGTVHYVAPEVLRKSYTPQADMWSLGVIVYMLCTGTSPWRGNDSEVLRQVRSGQPHYGNSFGRISPLAKEFIKKLLVIDPVHRMNANDALAHPWVSNRHQHDEFRIDDDALASMRNFAHSTHFRRAVLSMMAWSLTTENREELRQRFLALDTDHTGKITHGQMVHVLTEDFHLASAEAERLFGSLDINHNDMLDYSEFLAAVTRDRVRMHEDVLRKTFSRFDRDARGYITAEDLRALLGDSFEGEDVEDLIGEADTNKDGRINYDEFLHYLQSQDHIEAGDTETPHPAHPDAVLAKPGTRKALVAMGQLLDRFIAEHGQADAATAHGKKTLALKRKIAS